VRYGPQTGTQAEESKFLIGLLTRKYLKTVGIIIFMFLYNFHPETL